MFSIAADGRLLMPQDNEMLRDMTADALIDGDMEAVYRLTRYRLAPLPTSNDPPAWRATLEARFAQAHKK